jgi:peptidylprolyl isomerase
MMKIALIVLIAAAALYYFYNNINKQKTATLNIEQGEVFLAGNAKREGVTTTASGLQYEVLQQGSGTQHPSAESTVNVHYHGTLTDGTVFDSSVERGEPISFPLNRVIKGWTEGVQLMKTGDKFRFFIPADLGYGSRSAGKIPPGSVLIFDVELLAIE